MVLKSTYKKYEKYIANSSWIIFEKLFNMGVLFFVTIFVARYLGPDRLGILSYAVSLVALFATIGHMGLSGLVVREIVKNPQETNSILGTTFYLKLFGVSLAFVLVLISSLYSDGFGSTEFWVVFIVSLSLFLQPLHVIAFYFEANVQAKFVSVSNSFAVVFNSLIKILFVIGSFSLIYFALTNLLQILIASIMLIYFYIKESSFNPLKWRFSLSKAKELLLQGWLVFFGAIFATIYLKIDQVMLKWFVGNSEVGIYSVASQLSEVWYFLPSAIVASFFPRLIELRKENKDLFIRNMQKLFDLLFILALVLAIFLLFLAKPLILFFFGEAYIKSASILIIHIWAALFIFMRAAFSRWILIENVLIFSLITQASGAFLNVILNMFFIPKMGGEGAAIATLISYAMASYFVLFFYKKTRPIFFMMSKAIVSPLRYATIYIGKIYG